MHPRRIVRDAAVTRLTGLSATGANVFPFRSRNLGDHQLPGLRIYTASDRVDPAGEILSGSNGFLRIELRVEALIKASDDADDLIDAICEQIETAIATDETLGGATQWCAYQGTDIEYEDEDQTVMQATLTFEAAYIQE